MSLIRSALVACLLGSLLVFGACASSDYQEGGRRSDLGQQTADGVGLSASGSGGNGAVSGAGCAASGDGGQSTDIDCAP
ncbi:MAG: hypothetical protein ABW061_15155 [Polyangiaceae bacterium]